MAKAGAGAEQSIIIIKKKKAGGHAAHGGAWKVAYADFVTAMMAFFLLMWLLGSTSKEQKHVIQAYFKDPAASLVGEGGGMDQQGQGQTGPGGANAGMIDWNNLLSQPEPAEEQPPTQQALEKASDDAVAQEAAEREQKSLDGLQGELEAELKKDNSVFIQLRDQILIDQTALGLRIQIVDKQNRPMFAIGSPRLQGYAEEVLNALAPRLNAVPNKLSVNGHTDAVPYSRGASYTNWELSADRANSARRALLEGKYPDAKILTVQGMSDSVPRLPEKPADASNRRIVILVLKKEIEDALRGTSLVSRSHDQVMDELGSGAQIGGDSEAEVPITSDISIDTDNLGAAGDVISEFSEEDLVGL